jgi:hypothetical protein
MDAPDDLDEYLRGDSPLSRQYRREAAAAPPNALDRRVLKASRNDPATAAKPRRAYEKPPCLAPLAFAASVLLSAALVLAIVFGPQTARRSDDAPRLVRTAVRAEPSPKLYSSDPVRARAPSAWLAGRNREADAELRRFRSVYPDYPAGAAAIRPSVGP